MLLIQKDVQFLQNIACSYNRNSCAVQAEYADKILRKIQMNFELNPEQAEEYFEKYAYATK